ncbi:DUF2798 domain-containing protein [Colwelliaceae bacterium MEBiC 14330]
MLASRYRPLVFSFFMALFMSCLMSFVITLFNIGMVEGFVMLWLKAWGFAFIVAFPSVLIVAPLVNLMVSKLVAPPPKH